VAEIKESEKLGIRGDIKEINFKFIMERMRNIVKESRDRMREGIRQTRVLGYYEGVGHFTGDHTLEVNGKALTGKQIIIASGARPLSPLSKVSKTVDFLDQRDTSPAYRKTGQPDYHRGEATSL